MKTPDNTIWLREYPNPPVIWAGGRDGWNPWVVGSAFDRSPLLTVRSLICEAENRLHQTLALYTGLPDDGFNPLVRALLRSNSVSSTLTDFGFDLVASASLVEALELVIGLGEDEQVADHD